MKKKSLLAILLFVGFFYWLKFEKKPQEESFSAGEPAIAGPSSQQAQGDQNPQPHLAVRKTDHAIKEDLSSQFLTRYGDPTLSPSVDLQAVSGLIQSYLALIKVPGSLPLGENRDLIEALVGNNPYRTRFLAPESVWLNEKGELLDRWQTPLYFHGIDSKRVGVRSAGPDQEMWTADDITDGPDAEPLPMSK